MVLPLLHHGLKVICAPIPLTSLSDDAAALDRVLERTDGPVLLAGHAYAGAVIATTTGENVQGLVSKNDRISCNRDRCKSGDRACHR
jgi:hypothetical protein